MEKTDPDIDLEVGGYRKRGIIRACIGKRSVVMPLLFGVAMHSACALADMTIPANSSVSLGGGSSDLGCTDLIVAGALNVDGGAITGIRNVTIASGGSVTVSSGTISLSGNWANTGTFAGGTGKVAFVDLAGCAPAGGTISGNTVFAQLQFTTATGKTYQLTSGSTQTVTQNLAIQGAPGAPLIWQGTTAGQPANFVLNGTQSISNFGANNIAATGNPIAPGGTNALPGGANTGLFADLNIPIPTLSSLAMLLLSAAVSVFALRRVRGHASRLSNSTSNRSGL